MVLAHLQHAWPNGKWPNGSTQQWLARMEQLDVKVAWAAAGRCVRELKWAPSWSEFAERVHAERSRDLAIHPPAYVDPDSGQVGLPVKDHGLAQVWLAAARAALHLARKVSSTIDAEPPNVIPVDEEELF